ncbi:cysteine desulfurase IscS [Oxobacter pfennigii]|uniref:Cysteine desulfurase IscS n=1 Tax=Oxobacter pfennigii TaxID=36849 RepID=A0A0P8Z215_9CLOT|nr:cysteine desulfurase family protein [Oxobacter pfennigii]KPU46172.1 cysteine desulfurase IscS [Oxobacter pfennigii]
MEVYFDNSATTKPYDEVIDTMAEIMRNYYGNPSSAHSLGLMAEKKLNEAREAIAKTLNVSASEIVFTSGGSESNNFLLTGFVKEGAHVITTKTEHPSVLNTCMEMEGRGVEVTYLNVDNEGKIDLNELEKSINKNTQLVSIMHVNNETGIIQDIEAIGKLIKEKSSRAKFHVDAVQSYGKLNINIQSSGIDLLSASAHKIHGPRGAGIAYIRKGLTPKPLIYGGGQEKRLRSGTENLAAYAGFAKAVEIIYKNREKNFEHVLNIKKHFLNSIASMKGIKINGQHINDFSPYILSISFIGVRGEVLLHMLEAESVFVSTGSACAARDTKDSYVLKAIGLKNEEIKGTIRFSFSEFNTFSEVDKAINALSKCLKFLRRG